MLPLIPRKELSRFRSMINGIEQCLSSPGKRYDLGLTEQMRIVGATYTNMCLGFWAVTVMKVKDC